MSEVAAAVVVGLDVGGTKTNATVLTEHGRVLVEHMVEVRSCVLEGPAAAIAAIDAAMELVLEVTDTRRTSVRAIGLDTPGPASADDVISARGSTNFAAAEWRLGTGPLRPRDGSRRARGARLDLVCESVVSASA